MIDLRYHNTHSSFPFIRKPDPEEAVSASRSHDRGDLLASVHDIEEGHMIHDEDIVKEQV